MENNGTGEIVIYQPDEITKLEVKVKGETVWLNRHQLAQLFDRDVKTIGKHISNALKEELRNFSTVAIFATVQKEGNRLVERNVEYYNLDMIISIGYRVKSEKGVVFRQWANSVLKKFLLKGHLISRRMESLEDTMRSHDEKLKEHEKKLFAFSKLHIKSELMLDGIRAL